MMVRHDPRVQTENGVINGWRGKARRKKKKMIIMAWRKRIERRGEEARVEERRNVEGEKGDQVELGGDMTGWMDGWTG